MSCGSISLRKFAFAMLLAGNTVRPAVAADTRCCMTDGRGFYADVAKTEQRFQIYQDIGVDMLRVEVGWADFAGSDGKWNESPVRPYIDAVMKHKFRVKLILGTIMAPPRWFLDRNPDAALVNEKGQRSSNTISFWFDGVRPAIEDATRRQLDYLATMGFLDLVDQVVADAGPAGEPIYPAAWTQGTEFSPESFWFYADNAQADFRRLMQEHYKTIVNANSVWGTSFVAWTDVVIPKPGVLRGAFWNDVLTWYRDTKREFIEWQISQFTRQVALATKNRARVLVYIPGSDVRETEWTKAVADGSGPASVRLMCDSLWLIDTAVRKGCWLQYTGCENRGEVEHLSRYMADHGYNQTPMWGENAGEFNCAKDPLLLADIIIKNGLCGLDYTHSHWLFEKDQVTPTAILGELKKAYKQIRLNRMNEYK